MSNDLPVPAEYVKLANYACSQWAPKAQLIIVKDLVGGRSTASVLLVDIVPDGDAPQMGSAEERLSGEFVLKLDKVQAWADEEEPNEAQRHAAAAEVSPGFASTHIARLRRVATLGEQIAMLYEPAGLSLASLVTADNVDAAALQLQAVRLATALLEEWNGSYGLKTATERQLLEDWLGYRLDAAKARTLHEFVETATVGGRGQYAVGDRLLVNPLYFCALACLSVGPPVPRFVGRLHGDLHAGNVLLDRREPGSDRFWLIDFALSRPGPLFYDHSYFEFALLLHHLGAAAPERLVGVLEALDVQEGDSRAECLPMQDVGLARSIRAMRSATDTWQNNVVPNRRDGFTAQVLLSRVAVGLNWANKPLNQAGRRMALAYGSWNATKFLKNFQADTYRELVEHANSAGAGDIVSRSVTPAEDSESETWTTVWEQANRFDAGAAKFVLVADEMNGSPNVASLGLLPWSAIIDLDPNSDESGLMASVLPVLQRMRSVQCFGRSRLPVELERGTAWLMAAGWHSRHEKPPESLREWRRSYLSCVRELADEIRREVAPQPVKVIVLASNDGQVERLSRVLEALDECLGELSEISLVAPDGEFDEDLVDHRPSLTPESFAAGARRMYGTGEAVEEAHVPGASELVPLPIDTLRTLEEDLDVLHTRLLSEHVYEAKGDSEFWRGNPPSWADLHAGTDIIRAIHPKLVEVLTASLRQSRNLTIELHHSPGAGGTTAALRAAWALRHRYPAAVLRRTSRLTADRVDQLFQLAQQPVLLVADACVLSASGREDLYREFVARNSRVVILYVVRTVGEPEDRSLALFDPMSLDEAASFYNEYAHRTSDERRQRRLREIATSEDDAISRYRSPFFFGLYTYEREFQSVYRFVDSHVKGVGYGARKALLYLALASRYSQIGLDQSLLCGVLNLSPDSTLPDVVGADAERLVIRKGRQCKLLHPLVAEEVLRVLLGNTKDDGWKDGLKDLAMDFIHDVVRVLGNDAVEANRVFVQLFIMRDVWYERETKGRPRFARLITDLPTVAAQHQVLKLLTDVCPEEAHYWNHLGRHYYYEMKQDFEQAECYLQKAVELSPEDSYHHHSLGMVRRFWIENKLQELTRAPESATPLSMLREVEDLAKKAAASFERARELKPDDDHGYITHIQLILHIAERLVRAAGDEGLVSTAKSRGIVSEWLEVNLVVAEDLLARLKHLRGQAEPSRYEVGCTSAMTNVYGDFDQAIAMWEAVLEKAKTNQSEVRRALATAYHARSGRVWRDMPEGEIRRVVSLMERNLREDPTNQRDVRNWFQAYRRLREFSYLEALDRLESWAQRANAVDAYYYLYVLHYLRLVDGASRGEDFILGNLDKCKARARGRQTHSYEWLGLQPEWCPLVHHSELGEWDKSVGFYKEPVPLRRVTGTIETIKGKQSGTIRLGNRNRAFFVPGTRHWESKDINTVVSFYLGFSYEGFRAWSVEPATRVVRRPPGSGSVPASGPELSDVKEHVLAQLRAQKKESRRLDLSALGQSLIRRFGTEPVYAALGFGGLQEMLQAIEGLEVYQRKQQWFVRERST